MPGTRNHIVAPSSLVHPVVIRILPKNLCLPGTYPRGSTLLVPFVNLKRVWNTPKQHLRTQVQSWSLPDDPTNWRVQRTVPGQDAGQRTSSWVNKLHLYMDFSKRPFPHSAPMGGVPHLHDFCYENSRLWTMNSIVLGKSHHLTATQRNDFTIMDPWTNGIET